MGQHAPVGLALQLSALATSLAATLGHEGIGIHVRQYYSTDSGAFNQVAAQLALHGANPYTQHHGRGVATPPDAPATTGPTR